MNPGLPKRAWSRPVRVVATAIAMAIAGPLGAQEAAAATNQAASAPSLDETRLALGKWIETQQIIAKEKKEWQQGKEILTSRLDLVKKEISELEAKIKQAETSVAKANEARAALLADNEGLKAADTQLATEVAAVEGDVRKLCAALPAPLQTKVQPLRDRMPTEATKVRVSTAERLQNVLVILGEVHKANAEIVVGYEVQTLADGRKTEVQALYVGLGQAYFVNASGDAGIGRPSPDGWKWQPYPGAARAIAAAVEIVQGKQSPAFVPLPVRIQ